ncbi:hypothetical protein [Lysobacter sp. FW306-1B-D06B]|uniref:hypothetical protein n=1 Tax=Lysobacter sp. FW306-1B-D06B TaxID=3140250 RepID=UPI0031406863
MKALFATSLLVLVAGSSSAWGQQPPESGHAAAQAALTHFHPEGKPPSRFTVELRNGVRKALPFEDKRDFEENKKGLIAVPPFKQIMADAGNVAWDMDSYSWLLQDKDFESIHPSLQRQAILNMAYGLYEVLPDRIYQVRGFDLANVTFIKGNTGWIVFDPATAAATARATLRTWRSRGWPGSAEIASRSSSWVASWCSSRPTSPFSRARAMRSRHRRRRSRSRW